MTENSFDFNKDPIGNFLSLYTLAEKHVAKDPNAMTLATVGPDTMPSLRTVLYKGMLRGGVSFYTNYESQKAAELKQNHKAALLFFWRELDCQVRFSGLVEKLSRSESEAYFATRPRLSQIGAWASKQSSPIKSYEDFANQVAEMEKRFSGQNIPCPENWGGYHLLPLSVEFWFSRQGRLHERYVYERDSVQANQWKKYLKSP